MRDDPPRSYQPVTRAVLDRLSELAAADREERFRRRPRWAAYRDRVICVALCQGAALHCVDGRNGVKDLDVYTFYARCEPDPFPARWPRHARFDRAPFEGRYVDLMGRSLAEPIDADPADALRRYLARPRTPTARALTRRAVVLLDPEARRGEIVWPPSPPQA